MANLQNGFYQVNLGTNPNDGTGDSFRDAFAAENYNFALLGNTSLAFTTLDFLGSNITAPSGSNLNLRVSNGFVNLGTAGPSIGISGNILVGGGTTNQFLRAADSSGRVYWSGGAAGANGQIQFNTAGAFDANAALTYNASTGTLNTDNMVTGTDATVGRDLTVGRNANIAGQLSADTLISRGDATVYGNLTVWRSINDVSANTIELNAFVLALANNVNTVSLLNTSGITWGNTGVLSTADTPTIRFLDLSGTGNINQDLLRIYPGLWTGSAYFGVAAPSNVANIRPGNINFGPDVTVTFESAIAAARFSNLQADVFSSPLANIAQLNGNIVDVVTTEGGLSPDTRLLKLRNFSTTPGNVGLQIVNQSQGTQTIGWDIYSAVGNGTLVIGENSNPTAGVSNTRLQITREGNISAPYYPTSGASNTFIGFGPGNGLHAGLRYTGIGTTLTLEATDVNDQLQFNTGGATRVTILGGVGNATAGFVGVGTTAPVSPVQVLGTVDGNRLQSGLTVSRTGLFGGSFTLGVDNSNNQFFIADTATDTSRLVINAQGNVGLACTAPTVGLDVAGAGRFRTRTGTDAAMTLSGNSNIQTINLQFADSNGTAFWNTSYRAHTEYDDFWIYQPSLPNNPHLVLAYNEARVGINTINPLANLHVSSTANTNTAATIWAESAGGALVEINARPQFGSIGTRNNFPLALQVNSVNVVTVDQISNSRSAVNIIAANLNLDTNYYFGNGAFLTGISGGGSSYGNANVVVLLASGALTSNITTTGNVQGGYILGNGAFLTGISGGAGNYSNANVAAYLPTYGGNVGTGTGYIFGNGAFLTGVTAYTNANVFAYLGSNSNVTVVTTGNVTAASYSGSTGNVRLTANTQTWTFSTGGSLILPGNVFSVVYANGTAVPTPDYGNVQVEEYLASNANVTVITQGNITAPRILPQGNISNSTSYTLGGSLGGNTGPTVYWRSLYTGNVYFPRGSAGNGTVLDSNFGEDSTGLVFSDVNSGAEANVALGVLSSTELNSTGDAYIDGIVLSGLGYYGNDEVGTTVYGSNTAGAGIIGGSSVTLLWTNALGNVTPNTISNLDGLTGSQLTQIGVDFQGAYTQYIGNLSNANSVATWNYFANTKSTFPGNLHLGITTSDGNPANIDAGSNFIYANIRNTTGLVISNAAPANASAPGYPGQIAYASGFVYVCIAANTWQRAALTTWT